MSMLILLVILVGIGLYAVGLYNGLVGARNAYKNAFAQIDVQLTRRYDLIPNLVETVKGYIEHERETLEAVITARNAAVSRPQAAAANPGDPAAMQQLAGAENALTRRARPAVRARRGLSGPQGEPEHDAALRGADARPRTRSPSRARPTTTRSWATTTSARCFPVSIVAGMFAFQPAAAARDRVRPRSAKCRRSVVHLRRRRGLEC